MHTCMFVYVFMKRNIYTHLYVQAVLLHTYKNLFICSISPSTAVLRHILKTV